MPDHATHSPSKSDTQNGLMPFAEFMPWAKGGDSGAFSWLQPSVTPSAGAAEFAQSCMTFWQSRLASDLAAWKALAECRTPAEFLACPQRFVEEAANQYAEQFKTMQKLSQNVISEMFAPVGNRPAGKA